MHLCWLNTVGTGGLVYNWILCEVW